MLRVLVNVQINYSAGTQIQLFTCPNNSRDCSGNQVLYAYAYFNLNLALIKLSRLRCLHDYCHTWPTAIITVYPIIIVHVKVLNVLQIEAKRGQVPQVSHTTTSATSRERGTG